MALLRTAGGVISQNFQMPTHSHISHRASAERGVEQYTTHDGTLTNFMTNSGFGGGVSTVAHALRLNTQAGGIASDQNYRMIDSFTLHATRPVVLTWKVTAFAYGGGGTEVRQIGARYDGLYNGDPGGSGSFFHCDNAGQWSARSTYVASDSDNITVVAGDVLTLRLLSRAQEFYVNGVLVATHDLGAPAPNAYVGFASVNTTVLAAAAQTMDICYFDFKRF